MKYSLVQAEQDKNDTLVHVSGLDLLVDEQIVEEDYGNLSIDYSLEKGFVIHADDKSFAHRKIVTRRKADLVLEEASCQKAE